MIAVISTTFDDQYFFYLPITVWAWKKLGIDTICFKPIVRFPEEADEKMIRKMDMIKHFTKGSGLRTASFSCPDYKKATYAQCSRLYAAALPDIAEDEVLITGDIDMAVFNKHYFDQYNDGQIHIVGADLVPDKQYPMCYIAMPAKTWRDVMWIREGETAQEKLDHLLGHIECDHFRGNMWAKDQETAYNHITASMLPIKKWMRAAPGTQFATHRADRDGWPQAFAPDLIDAHLLRPGYTEENFAKILNLFQSMYPNEDFQWMIDYRNEYVKLIS